ncbi:helix-turn-helix domain-containing protein [Microbacteriaceae bacterium VKM Ac-2855]|nr:helix-turn-helix domain-containing protein [Microbacteriaceae bacterium VKM Ac-2855]
MEPQPIESMAVPREGTLHLLTASTRERTIAALLHDAAGERRGAFLEAISRHWLDRGPRTTVTAVLLECGSIPGAADGFGRHISFAAPARTSFIREDDGIVYLVSRDLGDTSGFEEWIRAEATRAAVEVRGIGSAVLDPDAADLGETAERARAGAELIAVLPELGAELPSALGGWILLQSVATGPRRLSEISPAAAQLGRGDPVQRETIEVYLDEGGQVRAACDRLHIHRTTLYYRLENMPDAVRSALEDGWQRSTLHLALKLLKLWEATGAVAG